MDSSGVLVAGSKTFKALPHESKSITGTQVGQAKLLLLVTNLTLECAKASATEASIKWLGHSKGKITFTECQVLDKNGKKAECEISPIIANVLALLFLHGKDLHPYLLFEPQVAGGAFFTMEPKGALCPLVKWTVTGSTVAEILNPLEFQVKPKFAINEGTLQLFTEDKLFHGVSEAHLTVEGEVWLTGSNEGKKWSAH
jgi:hypothetical protein